MPIEDGVLTRDVTDADAGRTVGQLLLCDMRATRTLIRRMKAYGLITLNGSLVRTNIVARAGDAIRVDLTSLAPECGAVRPEDVPLSILFEDGAVIALDKPSGVIVHPPQTGGGGTLANGLASYYLSLGKRARVHPVSRLDRETTGVVVFAKDPFSSATLHRASRARETKKEYLALVRGVPVPESGAVDLPIGRVEGSIVLRAPQIGGKPARTYYKTVWSCGAASLLKLTLATGRTHQIRVHMASLGTPVLADGLYGGLAEPRRSAFDPRSSAFDPRLSAFGPRLSAPSCRQGVPPGLQASPPDLSASPFDWPDSLIGRQALHSWRVSFTHPSTGERVSVEAAPPQDFLRALKTLGAPPWITAERSGL